MHFTFVASFPHVILSREAAKGLSASRRDASLRFAQHDKPARALMFVTELKCTRRVAGKRSVGIHKIVHAGERKEEK
ncbi:MAG: hypothetical protein ACRDGG_12095 [Anaerolineae bacterium]